MPLTPEQRAQISRRNGAKSQGPVTPEGKERSSRNALKTGEYAEKFAQLNEGHPAVLVTEDREAFDALVSKLTAQYRPTNPIAGEVVRDIAIARWQVERLYNGITANWHLAHMDAARIPTQVIPEAGYMENVGRAADLNAGLSARLNRQITQLHIHIQRLQRHFLFVNQAFGAIEPEPQPQAIENTRITPTREDEIKPAVYITETDQIVIEAYRREFPGHKIVILPPDNVAKGIEEPDDLPPVPRKHN